MSTIPSPDDPEDRKRSRLEDEVLEILQKSDRPISFTDHVRRKAAQRHHARPSRPAFSLGGSRWAPLAPFAAAFALAFLGLSLRDTSELLANVLALLSVAMLFLPFIMRARARTDKNVKRWRGRDINLNPPRDDWFSAIRDRFTRGPRL
ncbi:MAG TPA: hypothetical protein VGR16_04620 [Thermomicrobiales bacterium]|nr:hypothetical protein [Thermomicrobiales bacterium]